MQNPGGDHLIWWWHIPQTSNFARSPYIYIYMLHRTYCNLTCMIRYIIIYVSFIERKCKLPTWYGYYGTTCKARVSSSVCLTSMLRASGSLENIVTPFDEECQCFNLTSTYFRWIQRCWSHHINNYLFTYLHIMHNAYYIYTSPGFGISGFSPFMCMNQRIHADSKAAQNHKPYLLVIRKHPNPWIVPQSYPQSLCQWWFCSIDFIGRKNT